MKHLAKTCSLILLLVVNYGMTKGQNMNVEAYAKAGLEAYSKGDYFRADSLFTLIIPKSINGDVFYNRAQARINIADTCGYCNDLREASLIFGDKEAKKMLNEKCFVSVDTAFYLKNFTISNSKNFRYYKVQNRLLCDSLDNFTIHDRKSKAMVISSMNMDGLVNAKPRMSDQIAFGRIINNRKEYVFLANNDLKSIIEEKNSSYIHKIEASLLKKYPELKKNKEDVLIINLNLQVSEKGKIVDVEYKYCININSLFNRLPEFKIDLEKAFKAMQPLDPVFFFGEPVIFRDEFELIL